MFEAEKAHYTPHYFRKEKSESNDASVVMVPLIMEAVNVRSVLDIGCGVGAFLRRFKNHGVKEFIGVDGDYIPSWISMIMPGHFYLHDLKKPLIFPLQTERIFDLVMCLEVAEHLPESAADTLVDSICRYGNVVVFSAAVPGQGGVYHINEQPHEYWEEKFARRGYRQVDYLRPRMETVKAVALVAPWYRQNTFFYANKTGLAKNEKLNQGATCQSNT